MADDFEPSPSAGVGGGGCGPSSPHVNINRGRKGRPPDEDKLSQLRRELSIKQDLQKRKAAQQRAKDQALAVQWKARTQEARAAEHKELQSRLSRLKAQKAHAAQKAAYEAAAAAAAAAKLREEDSDEEPETDSPRLMSRRTRPITLNRESVMSGHGKRGPICEGPKTFRHKENCGDGTVSVSASRRRRPASAAPIEDDSPVKDLRAHALVMALVRDPQDEKKFRAIQQQGNLQEAAEREKKEKSGDRQADTSDDDEGEADPKDRTAAGQRHLARRYRLRMMHQVAGQVLQCRKDMTGSFHQSFLVHGLIDSVVPAA